MRQLLSQVECELPVDMVRTETRRILSDIVRENQARGVDEVVRSDEPYKVVEVLKQLTSKDEAEMSRGEVTRRAV